MRLRSKRVMLFYLIAAVLISLLVSCSGNEHRGIIYEKGSIALQNYDFKTGIIPLDYEWEFYWNRLYTPENFVKTAPAKSGWIKVPGVWNGYDFGGGKAGGDGFGTYRFTIKNIPAGSYGLKISTMATAYKLWINNKYKFSNGTVATDNSMVPQQMPGVALFDTAGEDVVITVQVSNFMSDKGGMWGSIYFGNADLIIKERVNSVGINLFLFGSFLIMALYHFGLSIFRRKSRFILYFGFVCLIMALRVLLTGEFFLVYIFPDINWNIEIKLEIITLFTGFTLFILFIKELYSDVFNGSISRFYIGVGIVSTLITIIVPVKTAGQLLPVYHLMIILGLIYITYVLVRSIRTGSDGALFIMAGFVLLSLFIINDILDSNNIIHTGYMFSYGLFLFIFSQSVILSGIFSRSFSKVEELSGKLQVLYKKIDEDNRNLEKKIEERTHELLEANSRLRELDHAKNDFFANISHEFRTPLTLMLAPVDEAISGVKLNRDTLEMMHRNGRNLLSLINDLLDISRITAGKMTLGVIETDISALVGQCCSNIRPSAKLKNIELVFNPCISPVTAFVDPGRIAQVLANFFSNAFKFTENGGRIELTVSAGDGYVLITFSDTGCGIAADKLDMVFDRFSQVDTGSKRRYEGTGIGLSIVKEFVNLHGGEVSIESRYISDSPDDHGTKFTIKLLSGRDHFEGKEYVVFSESENTSIVTMSHVRGIEPGPVASVELTSEITDDILSILVVEDNADIRKLLVKMLTGRYTIYEAFNGHEAVKLLDENEEIDLVLSDIMMPGMDGHELIQWIRSDERFEGLPVVFLTARAESFMKIEGLDLGAIDYVTKPFNPEELILRIRNQMELKKLRNSLSRNYEIISAKLKAISTRLINGDNSVKIESICSFIKEHYMHDLTRENIALSAGLNPDTFSRMFNQYTGKTLYDYINELRIDEAKRRLLETDDIITRISIDTGFENIRTFNRVFKKVTGMTPGEFRDTGTGSIYN